MVAVFSAVEFLTTSGPKTLSVGAANPEQLIRVLCDHPFDTMPIEELRKMAAWTWANPHKAKKRLGAFVMRWVFRWLEKHKTQQIKEWK